MSSTEEDQAQQKEAFRLFQQGEYSKSQEALQKLKNNQDPKLLHNIAVAAYYSSGCRETTKFLEDLNKIEKIVSDSIKSDSTTTSLDTYVLQFNKGLLYYQSKQFSTSIQTLEPLYHSIEALDESLAIKVCFLLLDNYLMLSHIYKITPVLQTMEKNFSHLLNPQNPPSEKEKESTSTSLFDDDNFSSTAGQGSDKVSPVSPFKFKLTFLLYRTKYHLATLNLKSTKQDLKSIAQHCGNSSQSNPNFVFLQSNLAYLQKNYRKSLKMLNTYKVLHSKKNQASASSTSTSAPDQNKTQLSPSDKILSSIYFNNMGCIHYHLKKYSASSFYLSKSLKEMESSYRQNGALGRTLNLFAKDRKSELFYNQGIQLLLIGQPELAFECFKESSKFYFKHCKVWIRLAECCIAILSKKVDEWKVGRGSTPNTKSDMIDGTMGEGKLKKVKVNVNAQNNWISDNLSGKFFKKSNDLSETDNENDKTEGNGKEEGSEEEIKSTLDNLEDNEKLLENPNLILTFALKSARNALYLSSPSTLSSSSQTAAASLTANTTTTTTTTSATSSDLGANGGITVALTMTNDDAIMLRQAALVIYAYLSLLADDPVVVLSSANELLANKANSSEHHKFLAHMYAAEALCLLNRPGEAAAHLSPNIVADLPGLSGLDDISSDKGHLSSNHTSLSFSAHSKCTLYVNMAVVQILQDKIGPAQKCITQALSINSNSVPALLLQVYIELNKGNAGTALYLLKQGRLPPAPVGTTSK